MKRARPAARVLAAFGVGVLLTILLPSDWMLIVTVSVLIAVALAASMTVRG